MGLTPIEIINKLRIERAQDLIRSLSTTVKLKEIAAMVGFDDPYYFSRVFKKWTNRSPKDYRRRFSARSDD